MAKNQNAPRFEGRVHPATMLLREVIDSSETYSKLVGSKLDVNETDFAAMEELIENGPMTAGDLAKAVGISPGSATVMIDRLVAVGHVTREPNPNDRRGIVVVPNPKSVVAAWKHISPLIEASEEALKEFSENEKQAIEKYLVAMLEVYKTSK
jgi:DNA-binding MarR family transcriptional regulator